MSRSSAPVFASPLLLLLLLVLILDTLATTRAANSTMDVSCSLQSCAALDITLLEEYVRSLNISAPLGNATRTNDSAAGIDSLPFGTLESDWTRLLLLLQNRQPEGTRLRDNLLRLSRIMLAAYFDYGDYLELGLHGRNFTRNDNGEDEGVDELNVPVPEIESQDQQATNVTLNSTVQKESTWINVSSDETATIGSSSSSGIVRDNATQPSNGSSGGSEQDSKTTMSSSPSPASGQEAPASAQLPNFNRTLPVDDGDNNGTNGSNSPSGENHSASASSNQKDNVQSDEATSAKQQPPATSSSEASEANEALHARSREEFLKSRRHNDDDDDDDDAEESSVSRFFTSASDESFLPKSLENLFISAERANNNKSEDAPTKEIESADKRENHFAERLAKSLEDVNSNNDNNNNNNNKNSHNNDTVGFGRASSAESDSLEFNSTKSIEKFFEEEGKEAGTTTSTTSSEEVTVSPSVEEFFAANRTDFENGTSESNEPALSKSMEALFEELETNGTSGELLTASVEAFFNETDDGLITAATPREDEELLLLLASTTRTLDSSEDTGLIKKDVSEDDDDDGSISSGEFEEMARESSEEAPLADEATTATTELIFDGASTTLYPDETALESTNFVSSSDGNGTKYFDTLSTTTAITSSDRDKSAAPASGKDDDLFKENTGQDDWSASEPTVSIHAAATSKEAKAIPASPVVRRLLMTFRHEPSSNFVSGKLTEPKAARESNMSSSSWERSNISSSSSSSYEASLDPSSSRIKRNRRSGRINERSGRMSNRHYRSY